MAFDVQDFQEEVIRASHQTPVVVDFWAEWCGPCRILGPVLERMAAGADGRWKLAKVDTEAHPDLAAAYGIRGIPDVRLFVDGESVDGFMGALPESAIQRWLDEALPQEGDRERAAELARVEELIAKGEEEAAANALEALLEGTPGDPGLRFRLARLLVFSEPERAMTLTERLEPRGFPPEAVQAVRSLGRLFQEDPSQEEPSPGEDGTEAPHSVAAAVQLLRERDFQGALEALISILREEGAKADPRVREACVAIFHHLGQDHPLVARFRGEVSRALYV